MYRLVSQSDKSINSDFILTGMNGFDISTIDANIEEIKKQHKETEEFNCLTFYFIQHPERTMERHDVFLLIFKGTKDTIWDITRPRVNEWTSDAQFAFYEFYIRNKANNHLLIKFDCDGDFKIKNATYNFVNSGNEFKTDSLINYENFAITRYSTLCPKTSNDFLKEWAGYYPNDGITKAFVDLAKKHFKLADKICGGEIITPNPQDPTEGTGTRCPTSGIYGGHGTKLTDIKLLLYTNKVTKGTITLSKPQLEVGTYATDWRPNPTDLAQANTESLAKKLEELTKKIEALEPKEVRKGGRKSGKKRD